MTFPEPWPLETPNPQPGWPLSDESARWGTGEPLPIRMANAFPGKATGPLHSLTVSTAAVFLPRDGFAVTMVCQLTGGAIRWTVDGTVPTSTVGFRADPGAIITVTGQEDLLAFQAIREGATDGTFTIQAYV